MRRADSEPFEAVVSDMDGVLTRTAGLHERAWRQLFDAYLQEREAARQESHRPFSRADYRAHLDGKPRYDGVADFLASRGIDVPWGQPSDDPSDETICGLGNRKNAFFRELIKNEGAEVFDDAVAAMRRWRRGGIKLAVISSSRNCRAILRASELDALFEVVIDGEDAAEMGLEGKRGILREAARRLEVSPQRAVVLEDATAGVRAARQEGFGFVVGVDRHGHKDDLHEAGADAVVGDVYRTRFLRRLPSARRQLGELRAWQGGRSLILLLDYDGTLSPIVNDPTKADISPEMRGTVEAAAQRLPVAIISGRDREDVQNRVGVRGLIYAGNHGFDIAGGGHSKILPEAAEVRGDVAFAEERLRQHLESLSGVIIEHKRFSVAVHHRLVEDECVVEQIARTVEEVREETSLRLRKGKKVLELEPAIDWNKGRAAMWLLDVTNAAPADSFVVYIGDDETDEDAFAALAGRGAGVRVGSELAASLADYRVADPDEVAVLLNELAEAASSARS